MRRSTPDFAILVPTLDEADNIDRLMGRLLAVETVANCGEILVIDDGSTDDTRERVRAWEALAPVRLVARAGRPDLAASILEGAALTRADVVVVMDADLSHPPERVPALVEPVMAGEADVAVGSRHVAGGGIENWPRHRRLLSRLGQLAAWPICDVGDPTSGFFAVRRHDLLRVGSAAAGYKILLELLMNGFGRQRVREIPIRFVDRSEGRSKLGLKQQMTYLHRLAVLAGGSVGIGSATRFGLVGMSGLALDALVFSLLYSVLGLGLGPAHVTSFTLATASNFTLNARWSFAGMRGGARPGAGVYLRYLAVCLLALCLRGGVLSLAVRGLALPPLPGIAAAVAATALVNYLGTAFLVFPAPGRRDAALGWRVAAIGIAAYMAALRFAYMGVLPLTAGETRSWEAAKAGMLPPLSRAIMETGAALFGAGPFGLRIGSWLLWFVTAWAVAAHTSLLYGKSAGLRALLLASVLPWFVSAGFIATPDAPLMALWSLVLLAATLLVLRPQPRPALLLVGALGAALLCDPRAALAVLPLLALWSLRPAGAATASYQGQATATLSLRSPPLPGPALVAATNLALPALAVLMLGGDLLRLLWAGPVLIAALPPLAASMDAAGAAGWQRKAAALWPPVILFLLLVQGGVMHWLALGVPELPGIEPADFYGWLGH